MSIFERIFGLKKSTTNADEQKSASVDRELFIDNTPPGSSMDAWVAGHQLPVEPDYAQQLEDYAIMDCSQEGYRMGYVHHNPDVRTQQLRKIRADFQSIGKLEFKRLRSNLGELRTEIAMLDESQLMPSTMAALRSREGEIESSIHRLRQEIEMSEEGKGLIRKAVESFSEGFQRGYQQFLQEEHLNNKYRRP